MDAQKRKALVRACGFIIEHGASLPDETDAAMTRLGVKTAAYYLQVITRLVRTLYHGDIDLLQFTQIFGDLVQAQLTKAWADGMQANGLDPTTDMTDELQAQLDKIILDEKVNITDFADEIVQASNLTGEPLAPLLARVDMWANRYDDVVNQATIATAAMKDKLVWVYGDTDHCSECEQLNGIVAYASEWQRAQVAPQQPPNDALTCGGWRCQCHLDPTTDRHTVNALDKIIAIALGPTGKSAKSAKDDAMPAEINPDPNKSASDWLKTHDPRICVYMTGTDPDDKPMVAYIADFTSLRFHVWQDITEGANSSRYPWPKLEYNNYWLSDSQWNETAFNLLHETVEDRKMAGRHLEDVYVNAHSYFANPVEWRARHGKDDLVKALEGLGWKVDFPDMVRQQVVDTWN